MEDNPHGNEDPYLEFLGIPFLLWFFAIVFGVMIVFSGCSNNVDTARPGTIVVAVKACQPWGGLKSFGVDQDYGSDPYVANTTRIEAVCNDNRTHILTDVVTPYPPKEPASAASQ